MLAAIGRHQAAAASRLPAHDRQGVGQSGVPLGKPLLPHLQQPAAAQLPLPPGLHAGGVVEQPRPLIMPPPMPAQPEYDPRLGPTHPDPRPSRVQHAPQTISLGGALP